VYGIYGSNACTNTSQINASVLRLNSVTSDSISLTHTNLAGSYYVGNLATYSLATYLSNPGSFFPYRLFSAFRKADGSGGINNRLMGTFTSEIASISGVGSGLSIGPGTPLTANTNYVLEVHVDENAFNNASRPAAGRIGTRICFKTAPAVSALNRPIGDYGNDNWQGSGQSGGCFAFGGTPAQVRACLCGARNRQGQWAATGTLEPNGQSIDSRQTDDTIYKWTLPSRERVRLGCTTS